MYTIGIIGLGIVGGAIFKSLTLHNIMVKTYDKFKNIGSVHDVLDTDFVFLCLPTPYDSNQSKYDLSALKETCSFLSKNAYSNLIVIKSTVEPGTSQQLAIEYLLNIVHNPEFLTARTAFEDFHYQKHIIIGKTIELDSDPNIEKVLKLTDFFKSTYPNAEITIVSSTESESIKLFSNCFYAVKIQFFNELFLLCQKMSIDYNKIKNLMVKNGWINQMHTNVPGPDAKLSFGGMCFPKDTNALLSFMTHHNIPHKVIEATVSERNEMRSD